MTATLACVCYFACVKHGVDVKKQILSTSIVSFIGLGVSIFLGLDFICDAGCSGGKSVCKTKISQMEVSNQFCVAKYNCDCAIDSDCDSGFACNGGVCTPSKCDWSPSGSSGGACYEDLEGTTVRATFSNPYALVCFSFCLTVPALFFYLSSVYGQDKMSTSWIITAMTILFFGIGAASLLFGFDTYDKETPNYYKVV